MCLLKGKGKGMTLLEVRNGKGLQFTLTADRCMDISRVSYKGDNMGYPLLSENAKVVIPANAAAPRDEHAKSGFENRLVMEKPQAGYQEMCYFYDVKEKDGMATVGIYNPDIKKGLTISFDKSTLNRFTEWKMMGETEYVLGLEPCNCTPDGRDLMRREGILKILKPGEIYKTKVVVSFTETEEDVISL